MSGFELTGLVIVAIIITLMAYVVFGSDNDHDDNDPMGYA